MDRNNQPEASKALASSDDDAEWNRVLSDPLNAATLVATARQAAASAASGALGEPELMRQEDVDLGASLFDLGWPCDRMDDLGVARWKAESAAGHMVASVERSDATILANLVIHLGEEVATLRSNFRRTPCEPCHS